MTKKYSKFLTFVASLLCFVIGLVIGVFANIFLTMPDSFVIPETQPSQNSARASLINAETVNNSDISIHFLELGNKYTGDCILIKVGDTQVLVDGGSKTSSIPYIEDYVDDTFEGSDSTLDYVIVTHAHEDHYAGFATNENVESLFDYYTKDDKSIGTIITFAQTQKTQSNKMYKNFLNEKEQAIQCGAKCFTALECWNESSNSTGTAQKEYILGQNSNSQDIILHILYTKFYDEANKNQTSSENNYSVCFVITNGDEKYLFTGDLEADGEESLIDQSNNDNNLISNVKLYKAGHHGSKTSSSEALLNVINPQIVVVCCVAGSSEYTKKLENQFPTQIFVDTILNYTHNVYVTTLCTDYASGKYESFNGTIVLCSKFGSQTQVLCSNENNTDILENSDWFKQYRAKEA